MEIKDQWGQTPSILIREVLEYFKSTGEGWQARMDGVLLEYVARHSRSAKRHG